MERGSETMISIAAQTRIFVYREPTDMRRSFTGLVALTESVLEQDPLSGHLFVFFNRRRDRIKILYWGGTGMCIWYQQLERGTFQIPDAHTLQQQQRLEIDSSQLSLILSGIDLSSVRQRKRFQLARQPLDK
jgi:transposase